MKLARTLLLLAGAANALFFLFHVWLGWNIHRGTQLPPAARSLLELLNGGAAVFVLLLAIGSFVYHAEMLATGLGRLITIVAGVEYALRALAEFVVTPAFTPAIFATCLATSLLYVGALVAHARAAAATPRPHPLGSPHAA